MQRNPRRCQRITSQSNLNLRRRIEAPSVRVPSPRRWAMPPRTPSEALRLQGLSTQAPPTPAMRWNGTSRECAKRRFSEKTRGITNLTTGRSVSTGSGSKEKPALPSLNPGYREHGMIAHVLVGCAIGPDETYASPSTSRRGGLILCMCPHIPVAFQLPHPIIHRIAFQLSRD